MHHLDLAADRSTWECTVIRAARTRTLDGPGGRAAFATHPDPLVRAAFATRADLSAAETAALAGDAAGDVVAHLVNNAAVPEAIARQLAAAVPVGTNHRLVLAYATRPDADDAWAAERLAAFESSRASDRRIGWVLRHAAIATDAFLAGGDGPLRRWARTHPRVLDVLTTRVRDLWTLGSLSGTPAYERRVVADARAAAAGTGSFDGAAVPTLTPAAAHAVLAATSHDPLVGDSTLDALRAWADPLPAARTEAADGPRWASVAARTPDPASIDALLAAAEHDPAVAAHIAVGLLCNEHVTDAQYARVLRLAPDEHLPTLGAVGSPAREQRAAACPQRVALIDAERARRGVTGDDSGDGLAAWSDFVDAVAVAAVGTDWEAAFASADLYDVDGVRALVHVAGRLGGAVPAAALDALDVLAAAATCERASDTDPF